MQETGSQVYSDNDPFEPLRTIYRIIIIIVTLAFVGVGCAAVALSHEYRMAVPWRVSAYAYTLAVNNEMNLLNAHDSKIADNLVYIAMAISGLFSLISLLGCLGALLQKRNALEIYAVIVGIYSLAIIICAISIGVNRKPILMKINSFGNSSLVAGFTDHSDGIDDATPGGTVAYFWQWMQVKYDCCGWKTHEDYKNATLWNRTLMVFNVSIYDAETANLMLTLSNREVLHTDINFNTSTASPGKIDLVALRQILPPTCCLLVQESDANQDAINSYLPNNFSNLELQDDKCPFTGQLAMKDQGCSESFETIVNRHIYAIIAGVVTIILLLCLTTFFSYKLTKYPTSEEWKSDAETEMQQQQLQQQLLQQQSGFDPLDPGAAQCYNPPPEPKRKRRRGWRRRNRRSRF